MSQKFTVWKFDITDHVMRTDAPPVMMPASADVLKVGFQRRRICVWARVSLPVLKEAPRRFLVLGTGHEGEMSGWQKFVETFFDEDATFVFHCWEVPA